MFLYYLCKLLSLVTKKIQVPNHGDIILALDDITSATGETAKKGSIGNIICSVHDECRWVVQTKNSGFPIRPWSKFKIITLPKAKPGTKFAVVIEEHVEPAFEISLPLGEVGIVTQIDRHYPKIHFPRFVKEFKKVDPDYDPEVGTYIHTAYLHII